MPYWAGDKEGAKWIGQKIDLWASVERSGVQIAGTMPEKLAKLQKKHHILNSIAISRKKTGQ